MTQFGPLRPAWTPLTITLMILGFVFFWPLGLAMIAYILWGDRLHRAFDTVGDDLRRGASTMRAEFGGGRTGNSAFDDYRDRELKRLEEERHRLDEMRAEFDDFLANLRRARDREEFDQFMAGRRKSGAEAAGAH